MADTATHHQQIDDTAVIHVHVIPVVETSTENDHGFAVGFFRIVGELSGDTDDVLARYAGDLLRPGRGIRHIFIIRRGNIFAAKASIESVVGCEQVEHRCHQRLALFQFQAFYRYAANQHAGMIRAFEMIMLSISEIGEAHICNIVMVLIHDQRHFELNRVVVGIFL